MNYIVSQLIIIMDVIFIIIEFPSEKDLEISFTFFREIIRLCSKQELGFLQDSSICHLLTYSLNRSGGASTVPAETLDELSILRQQVWRVDMLYNHRKIKNWELFNICRLIDLQVLKSIPNSWKCMEQVPCRCKCHHESIGNVGADLVLSNLPLFRIQELSPLKGFSNQRRNEYYHEAVFPFAGHEFCQQDFSKLITRCFKCINVLGDQIEK